MPSFEINKSELVRYTNTLEKLHKSALPIAVRSTLNDAAFEMKKTEIEKSFQSNFTTRKKNFIKSHTLARKSKNTFNINQMVAKTGVIEGKSQAGDNLEVQESGGRITNRENIPLDTARTGKNNAKLVSKKYYLNKVKGKHKAIKKGDNKLFIKAAFAAGKGGHVIYGKVLHEITSIRRLRRGPSIKTRPLYSVKPNRSVPIKKTSFMSEAGKMTLKKIDKLYIEHAINQINKYKK